MFTAKEFRKFARDALKGRWPLAVIAGLVATILGGASTSGISYDFNVSLDLDAEEGSAAANQIAIWLKQLIQELEASDILNWIITTMGIGLIIGLVVGAVFLVLGSVVGVGYAKFNLDLVDRQKEPEIGTLFGYFKQWKTTTVAALLRILYVFLWSLLLVIPGMIAVYSYAMTDYILAENPELTASEAIARSKEMMAGNRWRLFCLQLSFIGWDILCAFTAGLGSWVLSPYKQAANAAFYREVSGTAPAQPREPVTPYIEDVL